MDQGQEGVPSRTSMDNGHQGVPSRMDQGQEGVPSRSSLDQGLQGVPSMRDHGHQGVPDGGWGWIVVAASFSCNLVLDGMGYTFGILMEPLMAHYNVGRGAISSVGSLFSAGHCLYGPIASFFINKFGMRAVCMSGALLSCVAVFTSTFSPNVLTLMLTFSLLGGLGLALMYVPACVAVTHYFDKRLSLATGLSTCGSGAGTFLLAPLVTHLESRFGWQGCNRILAGLCFQCLVFGALMRPVRSKMHKYCPAGEQDQVHKYCPAGEQDQVLEITQISDQDEVKYKTERDKETENSLWKNYPFLLILIANVPAVMGSFTFYMFLPMMAHEGGLKQDPGLLISLIGIFNTVSRIIFGFITDFECVNPLVVTTITLFLGSLCPPMVILCSTLPPEVQFTAYASVSVIFGISLSALWVLSSPLLVDILGLHLITSSFGILSFVRGLAALIGPPIAGFLIDATENNRVAFWLSGGLLATAALLHLAAWRLKVRLDHVDKDKMATHNTISTFQSFLTEEEEEDN